MQLSKTQITGAVLLIILLLAGAVLGVYLSRRPQTVSSEASEPDEAFATLPPFSSDEETNFLPKNPQTSQKTQIPGDFNNDGFVNNSDESLFMSAYQSGNSSADLDNSGQVNTLDISYFNSLLSD